MNIKVGDTFVKNHGTPGPGVVAYKVTGRPPRKVRYVRRKNDRGAWTKTPTEIPLKAFTEMVSEDKG